MTFIKTLVCCFIAMIVCDGVCLTMAKGKVFLGDVDSMTFQRGAMTTSGVRTSPIPQMSCVGGTGSGYSQAHPPMIQCYNRGSDGTDIQWECKGELLEGFRFGSTMVACEGYSSPSDPYILEGSCGVEYTLDRIPNHSPTSFGILIWFMIIFVVFASCCDVGSRGGYREPRYGGGYSNFWPGAAAGYMAGSYTGHRGGSWFGSGGGTRRGGGSSRMSSWFGGTRRR